ncbi:MAG: APC family permease, partial [Nitrospirales bacterium]
VGFLNGWTSFTMGFSAPIAAAAVSFTAYFLPLLPWQPLPGIDPFGLTPMLLPVVLVWSLTAFHLAGVAAGGSLQRLLTATTVLAMLFLVGGAFTLGQGTWAHFTETPGTAPPRVGTMVVSLIFVMYAYSGWNVAGYIAGEIRDPGRTIPRTMVAGTLFVTVLYLALNAVYLYALPVGALAQEPILPVAEKAAVAMFGAEKARLVAALLCCSIAAAVSAMIWAGPRVYFAMARDGLLPSLFGRTGPRSGAPVYAILLQSGWATVLILSGTFEQLVIYSGFILTLFSGLAVAAVPILRWRRADLPRPYRAPGYPIVPGLFSLAALVIVTYTVWERPTEAGWALATLAAGYPLYLWSRRRTRDKAQDPERGRGTQG